LTLLTFRPDFSPPWTGRSHLTLVTLPRLPRRQAVEMTGRVAHGKALPSEVVAQVVAKTDGVPLFVEELTKMVLESGLLQAREDRYELTGLLPPLAIPTTLHDSLMARLDRLATVKALAQLGATLGREFAYELLQAVSPWDEGTLQQGLHQLVAAEFLYQQGLPPQATYRFKHALIQDAAYQSLLKSTRQQYHQRIAQVLAARFPEVAATQPELLAQHYTQAGLTEQAIAYWQRAGQRASERSAHVEAIHHLTKGLELLRTLPDDTPERPQQELTLTIALATPLMATRGYAAPEVGHVYARARELCLQVEGTPQLFPVLWGFYMFSLARAALQTAREMGEQCLTLARNVQDPALLVEAHRALGVTLFHLGSFAAARTHLEQGGALYDPQTHRDHAFLYVTDPKVACLSYGAKLMWILGSPDQALERCQKALTLAQELAHPHSLAQPLCYATYLYQLRGEAAQAYERAEELVALCHEQGFAYWLSEGIVLRGWALAAQGQHKEGIGQMRQGLAASRAAGSELLGSHWLALLVEAYRNAGQSEEGVHLLAEALALVRKHGERYYEAELYRLKGKLLQCASVTNQREAEACFQRALARARRQQAKSWELRAAMSLSRLWQQQGKQDEARELLAPIYGWFTEGFDTADLQEAKALLEALA
jgi:predicted ATPase